VKKNRKTFGPILSKALTILIVIILLPFANDLRRLIIPDVTGNITTQISIIKQKLESSQRLEVTTVDEEAVLESKTSVIIFGTVGTTTIRYRYTASIGIDLSRVIMSVENNRIIFILPAPEVLNDGIEALEINKNNLFSKAIEKSVETLLSEQREKCRNQYLTEEKNQKMIKDDAVKAFHDTVCRWLEESGEKHYEFDISVLENDAAV